MSGHSHFATIKRQKETKDAARGKVFSKLAKAISVAVKTGGGPDPESNYKLRMAIEAARALNAPKENIERAISKGGGAGGDLQEITYEGFGPYGIAVLVEVATDNKNRTAQEIKNIFERGGGSMGGPGSVAFNFEPKGLILIKKDSNSDEQMLKLIDAGVEDMEEVEDLIEIYVAQSKLHEFSENIRSLGFEVEKVELIQKPKNFQVVDDPVKAEKALTFLETLQDSEDVQQVFANMDIPEGVLGN
jgi:YebC/PmpR family DNA-binding regulatory protein